MTKEYFRNVVRHFRRAIITEGSNYKKYCASRGFNYYHFVKTMNTFNSRDPEAERYAKEMKKYIRKILGV